jgi:hypothetical protein
MKSKMGALLLLLLLAIPVRSRATTLPDSCGADKTQFEVKTAKNQPAPAPPADGKALIVFVENFDQNEGFCIDCKVTTRVGVDGNWVGANHGNSYFSYSVDPGQHHLCADWQSDLGSLKQKVGLAQLDAAAGSVYYYQVKVRIRKYGNAAEERYLDLAPIDPDEGKYLVKIDPQSTAIAKK